MSTQTTCFINSCSFWSVCDAYDGGIVPSLNNPLASLSASNTSFVGCYRTRNVEYNGTSDGKLTPGRQNTTENGANSFTWCEWNGSKATGNVQDGSDSGSNGGAIYMHNLKSGEMFVSHCAFNDCYASWDGGAIMAHTIKSVDIRNNFYNSCIAQNQFGGGMCVYAISSCVRISGCEFQNCKAYTHGGGLFLDNFNATGAGCVGIEKGEGESACVFDCIFTSCSLTSNYGGGMFCRSAPEQFKMRSIQFISCSATAYGGGLYFEPKNTAAPTDGIYCYFLFFHECKCRTASIPYGHDMIFADYYNLYLNSGNPFYECYTTNTDEKRACYAYNYSNAGAWKFDQTMKKMWLKRGILNRFVAVSGGNAEELCGLDESSACRTIGVAVEKSVIQVSLSVTLMEGDHKSEATTIAIETKKISIIGKGREACSIGTEVNLYYSSFSSSSTHSFFFLQFFLRKKVIQLLQFISCQL